MPIQKKHGKGRLDKWYKLAKERGYRARAAFKLIQLNKKFGFLEKSKVALDLCAAPGSWCQVCAETMPQSSIIIGVDLAPIKPIPKVITFQSDITTEQCRATIRGHLKTWKADVVLHDGAPNVGTAWIQDSYNQAELVLHSLRLATDFLIEGGTFVTKVFRSKDYNPLLWIFKQLFTKVDATKPPSSRNVSAEIFVVCRGFKAPKRIDPRLLDPRSVFEDLAKAVPNSEAKVYNPDVKKRQREGYDEGDYIQFKEVAVSEFIQTNDPISILGQYNRLSFEQKEPDVAQSAIDKLPETTQEIRNCCADLKVLGRKDFKLLLKWRLRVRDVFGFPSKKSAATDAISEEVAEAAPMDEELKIQQELQDMKDRENSKKKRERRRDNEKKQKDIVRMQLHMMAPMEIGMEEEGPRGEGTMFKLKSIDQTSALNRVAKGRMVILSEAEARRRQDVSLGSPEETEDETDEEEDQLERELDGMYEQYIERRAETDAKYRAKRVRREHDDEEWQGVSGSERGSDSDDDEDFEEESCEDDSDGEGENQMPKSLIKDLDTRPREANGLSRRAQGFFSQDIFQDIPGLLDIPDEVEQNDQEGDESEKGKDEDDDVDMDGGAIEIESVQSDAASDVDMDGDEIPSLAKQKEQHKRMKEKVTQENDTGFEVVKRNEEKDGWEGEDERDSNRRPNIDIITAEAMTLAHQLATGQRTAADLIDEGFNKHSLKDRDGLPDWFLEDEGKHGKPHRPITKAAAAAIKEKLRAYNARPIKKVAEARARKKFKTAQRLEKLKKKADLLAGEEGMSEKEKAASITKLMAKAGRKQRRTPVKVVKAAGANRGIAGRPRGVKGRYRMVDPRMKKELRAMKRIAAKGKKR